MDSCDATGPPGIACVPPVTVWTVWNPWRFWTTPCDTKISANTNAIGNRIRTVDRTMSDQKLPTVSDSARVKPRTRATATAMPTAAETKFWTARPLICTRWPMVDSPE